MTQRVERSFAGRPLIIETGRMAKQAAGSAVVQFGETMVLAAVTVSENQSTLPFFPDGFKNEVQVFIYVISADQENDADVLALLATSYALNASKVPFMGPVAAVRVGRVQGKWVLNPTFQQLAYSDMELVVTGSADSIVMV